LLIKIKKRKKKNMTENTKPVRLKQAATEFNVGLNTIVDFLKDKGIDIEANPNTKLDPQAYALLTNEYSSEKKAKEKSKEVSIKNPRKETLSIDEKKPAAVDSFEEEDEEEDDKHVQELIIKDVSASTVDKKFDNTISHESDNKLKGPKILGKIDLTPKPKKKVEEAPKEVVETPIEEPKIEKTEEKPPVETPKVEVVEEIKVEETKKEIVEEKVVVETPKEEIKEVEKIEAPVEEVVVAETVSEEEKTTDVIAEEDLIDPVIRARADKLKGVTSIGKIDLTMFNKTPEKKKPIASSVENKEKEAQNKKKRKRIKPAPAPTAKPDEKTQQSTDNRQGGQNRPPQRPQGGGQQTGSTTGGTNNDRRKPFGAKAQKPEVLEVDIQKQIKDTLAELSKTGKSGAKGKRLKKEAITSKLRQEEERKQEELGKIKVTEYVSANELAKMLNVGVTEIISKCMELGYMVSINQRLDAETIVILAEEYNYKVEFVSADSIVESKEDEIDTEEDLLPRPPIVTVMGHVDHGKTSLLDYIRKANVIAGEAGGITQHIGAYNVVLDDGRKITFLDTPGHEAFTAMRARGAKVTDVAIIVVAADDSVMPQTIEAINHAQAAGVPLVFAINKIDKPNANSEKIKEQLANLNILVEDWGGKYQSQEISAKAGLNIMALLDKVLLEAELLDLRANPDRNAHGTVIESELDKGKGYVSTILVQKGTLKIGDMVLAGQYYGKVKALYNERGQAVKEVGPSMPVSLLGLNGAPQAGDLFKVMIDEREAKEIANKRMQLMREQGIRTKKHITLDEIGRRLAIGDFQELNVIVKGDVDGSIEALSDSLLKLSTDKIQVNVIHKSVGQISESDVLLASASNAIIIGFQVRPSSNARKLAEAEQIDIRLYSIIYDAIEEVKAAMEGMLAPEMVEKVTANIEIRETFKITKVGTIAGCMVLDGKITRNSKVRLIRDGIVIYTGELGSLKRFKDDVKEVAKGFECGLNIANFNDIKVGDIVEAYEMVEVKSKL
jgi:translation initiation factor IF-2